MKPSAAPITKEELAENVQKFLTDCFSGEAFSELTENAERIRGMTQNILSELPGTIRNRETVTQRCSTLADNAVAEMEKGQTEAIKQELHQLKNQICQKITLILCKEYIDSFIQTAIEFCKSKPLPKKWSMGSVARWKSPQNEPWGQSFYKFWRRNVEKTSDEAFRQRILLHLPEDWQEKFETRHLCPHEWKSMTDNEIAMVLQNLQQTGNPSSRRWGLGSVAYWTSPQNKPWGQSFYMFWRNNVEKNSDKAFRQRILLHLPEEWQENYKMKERK